MPLYEYECRSCGRREELIQRVGAPPVGPCSECGGEMRKLLSAPAFQFKGSGWYVTDYAKKGSAATADTAAPKAAAEGTKPSQSETPAAKTEAKKD